MLFKLFLAFSIIPAVEIYILIKVGSIIGPLNTLALVILSAMLGAWLARTQGLQTMLKLRENLNQGIMPAEEILDAFIILAAGLTLLTPGFVTDAFGLFLLFPPTRMAFKRWLRRRFDAFIQNPNVRVIRYK